ncbi:MAG: hypothetical protein PHG02_00330 [Oscillospiraceae bacterium]|nr:hypothetical protein [Oscillospiraceae bacterium]
MTQLLPITAADTAGKKHTGQPDPPATGTTEEITLAVQQLMDAIPNLHEEKINTIINTYNKDGITLQAHMDSTQNPHAITAAQVGAYTIVQTDAKIDEKIIEMGAGDMAKGEYAGSGYGIVAKADLATSAANSADGVKIYTQTKTGTVHALAGNGANGRMLVTALYAAGDTFTVNGTAVSTATGAEAALTADNIGTWVSFTYDGTQLNFTAGQGKAYTDTKLSMKLLWENISPSSTFAEQTLALDLSKYDGVVIALNTYISGNTVADYVMCKKGEKTQITFGGYSGAYVAFHFRYISTSDNGVSFENNVTYIPTGNNTDNNYNIPVKIYGIKGVQ